MKLNDRLNNLTSYPFHMPGHKRNTNLGINSVKIDITEIDGFDNLHNPKEILKELEEDITTLFKSKKSIISVNGSTCCILSAISAVCNWGDEIIIARNCHKSVYNACFINRLKVNYIVPEFDKSIGVYTYVTQNAVYEAIKSHPTAKAIVITSPTYEGIVSKIHTDIPLIIDSAHGSHFGFADYLPERAKGDIVIQSFHKTLPCLTQCAAVHINNEKYISRVKKYMDIYETSSPSYVLLASVDKCVDFLKDSKSAFDSYKMVLNAFYNKINALKNIKIYKNDDITRLILSADGYSGSELADYLRKCGIEPEGVGINYVILISTVCDTENGFELLSNALAALELREKKKFNLQKPVVPEKIYEQYEITETDITHFDDAKGKISAESIFAYPPDVPIITIGERIEQNTIDYIKELISLGVNILSDSNLLPDSILTKRDL